MPKQRTLRAVLCVGILTCAAAFLLAEVCVRWFSAYGYVTPEIMRARSLQYSGAVLARHIFPQKEQFVVGLNGAKFHINSEGYRGRAFAVAKPQGTTRVIIYGGSSVFDTGASDPGDWPHLVEQFLHEMGFSNIEVINAGVPGHASFDVVGRLLGEGHRFAPDYVLFYGAWNDIKYFRSAEPVLRQLKPYDERADPRLNYQGPLDRLLTGHSQLFMRLRSNYYNWRLGAGLEGARPTADYASRIEPLAVKQYEIDVRAFADVGRDIGAVPVLMTEARVVARDNAEAHRSLIDYDMQRLTHEALCDAFEATDKVIWGVARDKNVPVIDAAAQLTGRLELFSDHVHTTAKGSEELARITADGMARLLRSRSTSTR